jgi:hypothetical protein
MDSILGVPAREPPALYTLEVPKLLGANSPLMLQDALRMVCIQFMIQACAALSQPNFVFLSEEFASMLLYVVLGVMLYWLVARPLVAFRERV